MTSLLCSDTYTKKERGLYVAPSQINTVQPVAELVYG